MSTILTIIKDPARAQMYDHLAQQSGVNVIQSGSGLHALTQLERIPISVIVCDAQMEDMSGEVFRSVVMAEMKTIGVPIFILPDAEALAEQSDLRAAAPTGPEVLRQILQVAGIQPSRFAIPVNTALPAQLQGDLGQFALTEFFNWVAEMRFHGHWLITVEDTQDKHTAHVYMENGNITYAEFAGIVGKTALLKLLGAINLCSNTEFAFYKIEKPLNIISNDLQQSTQRLLMELAVDIDHLRSNQVMRHISNT